MAERIINVVCPNCKHGIKHDTLMNTTTSIRPEDYPEVNKMGRCWCKTCQHGTYPTEDGLCTECISKGRETRLRPVGEKFKSVEEEIKGGVLKEDEPIKKEGIVSVGTIHKVFEDEPEVEQEDLEDVFEGPVKEVVKDLKATSKSKAKRVAIQKNKTKVLR